MYAKGKKQKKKRNKARISIISQLDQKCAHIPEYMSGTLALANNREVKLKVIFTNKLFKIFKLHKINIGQSQVQVENCYII